MDNNEEKRHLFTGIAFASGLSGILFSLVSFLFGAGGWARLVLGISVVLFVYSLIVIIKENNRD